jgi:hypothetical protein
VPPARINITPAVRAKIGSKHGVTRDQVLAACTNVIRTLGIPTSASAGSINRSLFGGYTEENQRFPMTGV